MTRVAVTGAGAVLPGLIGNSRTWLNKDIPAGIGELTLFAPPGKCEHAGEVTSYDWKQYLFSNQTYSDRCTQLALGAARLVLEEAGLTLPLAEDQEVGLCFGTCWGCLDSAERFYAPLAAGKGKLASSLVFSHSYSNCPTSFVAIEFGLRGYSASFAGSTEAGWWALLAGYDALISGAAARVLVGAAEGLSRAWFAHAEAEGKIPDTSEQVLPEKVAAGSPWSEIPSEGAFFMLLESESVCSGSPLFWLSEISNLPPADSVVDGGNRGAVGSLLHWAQTMTAAVADS